MRLSVLGLISALVIGQASTAGASDGLVLDEGEWEFKVGVTRPMESKPTVRQAKSCQTGEKLTPRDLMPGAQEQGCELVDVKIKGKKMDWKINCEINGQKGRGKGKFSHNGSKGSGRASIKMTVMGQVVSINTKFDAKRLGDCPGSDGSGSSSLESATGDD